MLDKLPMLQKFLSFITRNKDALVLFLLLLSIAGNIHLLKLLLEEKKNKEENLLDSIKYERERGKSFEDIVKEYSKKQSKKDNDAQ